MCQTLDPRTLGGKKSVLWKAAKKTKTTGKELLCFAGGSGGGVGNVGPRHLPIEPKGTPPVTHFAGLHCSAETSEKHNNK